MHFAEYLCGVICVFVMSFRRKYKTSCKGWVSEERADAGNDVSEEEVVGLPTKMDFLAMELRLSRHLFIDDLVELPSIAI